MNSENTKTEHVQEYAFVSFARNSNTRVVLLEAPLSYPSVPVCACIIQGALILHGVLDHALAFEDLQGEAHRGVPKPSK